MSDSVIRPAFHHINLKTTRLQEMIDWYAVVVGAEVTFQSDMIAFVSNDEANHRIALTAFDGFAEDPERGTRIGLHHTAFEYGSLVDLDASYLRLSEQGIVPDFCIDHGPTFSYYYLDPDGNHVELQADNFDDWAASKAWMRDSEEFRANAIGVFVDPDLVAAAIAAGRAAEIHAAAMAGEFLPEAMRTAQ